MSAADCIRRLTAAAGRALTDDEVSAIFTRIHQAALDIKAGRVKPGGSVGGKVGQTFGALGETSIEAAAREAAARLEAEAAHAERKAYLQLVALGARMADFEKAKAGGLKDLDAVEAMIARDYTGRTNLESIEQRETGMKAYYSRKLLATWEALGNDFLGFFQDRQKLYDLVRELRGEDSGNPLAKRGAKAFHDVAEEARQAFNNAGGDVGQLDDWGMPQHHSQEKVAAAGRDTWVDAMMGMVDRARYVDDLGAPYDDARMREFLGKAWDTIATNGNANLEPGKSSGVGSRANRHAESRQIHFKDAQTVIDYWNTFGERTAVEILLGHVETMARDVAFVEAFGPNPNTTYQTLRDTALRDATLADPTKTIEYEGRAVKLDTLYNYASGRLIPTYRRWLRQTADAIAHLNTAGKLGGAAIASFIGDKPMMEAVAHMNNLPALRRWQTELALLNPLAAGDRRLLQQQGLMLDSVRSGLQRFYEGLGQSSLTGRIANAVMRVTGMQAINDIRKGSFGLSLMSAIGEELAAGKTFADLADADVRALRNYGITEVDWNTWALARRERMPGGNNEVLTPESIARIPDRDLENAQIIGAGAPPEEAAKARRDAIVKLLGAVNTESEFAIVTPGWRERSTFYGSLQRGTFPGEIWRSILQFKAFPWAMLQRGMDAVANQDTPTSKAAMTAYLVVATTVGGAMLMQVREMLSGKDPRDMTGRRGDKPADALKFWGAAFLQGGALGIYGDFLYSVNQTRYGSGPLEALGGPTMGPLLELGIVQPLSAAKASMEGKQTHLAAQTFQDLKGWVPGGNVWYAKAALDHLIWQRVMDYLSPGYLSSIRQKTAKEYGQDWWWSPGEVSPARAPALERAVGAR